MNKKNLHFATLYLILGLLSGVFMREFTRHLGFVEHSTLNVVHAHVLVLGMVMFLVLHLFSLSTNLCEQKGYGFFLVSYNVALLTIMASMLAKGVMQVVGYQLTGALRGAFYGISGLAHILIMVAFIVLFKCLYKAKKN